MKNKIFIIIFLFATYTLCGQHNINKDSLEFILNQGKGDTSEVNTLVYLALEQNTFDPANKYAEQGLSLAKKINYKRGEADCYWILSRTAGKQSNFSLAIEYALSASKIYEDSHDNIGTASVQLMLQGLYRASGDYEKSLEHAFKGYNQIAKLNSAKATIAFPGHGLVPLFLAEIAQTYILDNKIDSASTYAQKAINENELFNGVTWNFPVYLLATIQNIQGDFKAALQNYHSAIPLAIQNGFSRDTLQIFSGMSSLFKKTGQLDSAIYYAQLVVHSTNQELEIKNLLEAVSNLEQVYKLKGNNDSAYKYIELNHNLKDSLFSNEKDRQVQNISFNEQLKKQEILSAQARYKSKIQLYGLLTGLLVLFLITGLLWRNNQHKQKAKLRTEKAYTQLKSTQAQLIQSEKMASLGELTAGIAHEIQNPLNFVNNFSEVNKELLAELKEAIEKGNYEDAKEIAKNVIDNQEKINHHGKRADSIVKGMLQHSKKSSGIKQPTDLNKLADEYLRLSYHGMRAKDKFFNVDFKTNFDDTIGEIGIIPQDIGRVLLNLYNNAFYAVAEKMKLQPEDYEPIVSVSTKKINNKVEISVRDNGNGIPGSIKEKIYQPFFTTKPTGQGTGLGLSLSYDIIKAHGGELKVVTKEGEYAEFIIHLPV